MSFRRRYANREAWARLLDRGFDVARVERPGFQGYVTLLEVRRVTEPLVVSLGGKAYRLADRGFRWLQHFPDGERYTLTSLLDDRGALVQWYFDVVAETGVDERGIPWWDDLFLDVAVLPDRTAHLLDEDELETARTDGSITEAQYTLARAEGQRILKDILEGRPLLLDEWQQDLQACFGPRAAAAHG